MWHVSALYRPCIGHRTGYSLREMPGFSGLASADFEGFLQHSYKRCRPGFFLRALRLGLFRNSATEIAAMLRHADADAIHIRDIGAAQPLSIAFARGALLGSALRSRRLRHHYKPEQRSNPEDPGAMQPGGTFHGRFSLCGSQTVSASSARVATAA